MGIACGLIAAFCWGLGDYLITALTRLVGTARALVYIQILSLLSWVVLWCLHPLPFISSKSIWMWALGAGVCHVLGLLLSYRAFEIGTLALVSPIASGFAIVTAVLAISTGEHPPASALGGAGLLFLGIVLATYAPGHVDERKAMLAGVSEAIGCAVAFGVMFWMMKPVETGLGTAWAIIVLKTMASGYALVAFTLSRSQATAATGDAEDEDTQVAPAAPAEPALTKPSGLNQFISRIQSPWALAVGVALVDTGAWVAYNAGISLKYTTIVTALASLFSVVTILLAWALLHERLARSQWVGVFVILLGVLIVSVFS